MSPLADGCRRPKVGNLTHRHTRGPGARGASGTRRATADLTTPTGTSPGQRRRYAEEQALMERWLARVHENRSVSELFK